jgi:hypothetical protein
MFNTLEGGYASVIHRRPGDSRSSFAALALRLCDVAITTESISSLSSFIPPRFLMEEDFSAKEEEAAAEDFFFLVVVIERGLDAVFGRTL